jgi:hypothetical protein
MGHMNGSKQSGYFPAVPLSLSEETADAMRAQKERPRRAVPRAKPPGILAVVVFRSVRHLWNAFLYCSNKMSRLSPEAHFHNVVLN